MEKDKTALFEKLVAQQGATPLMNTLVFVAFLLVDVLKIVEVGSDLNKSQDFVVRSIDGVNPADFASYLRIAGA